MPQNTPGEHHLSHLRRHQPCLRRPAYDIKVLETCHLCGESVLRKLLLINDDGEMVTVYDYITDPSPYTPNIPGPKGFRIPGLNVNNDNNNTAGMNSNDKNNGDGEANMDMDVDVDMRHYYHCPVCRHEYCDKCIEVQKLWFLNIKCGNCDKMNYVSPLREDGVVAHTCSRCGEWPGSSWVWVWERVDCKEKEINYA